MTRLVLVGAAGLGREALAAVRAAIGRPGTVRAETDRDAEGGGVEVVGFVDDAADRLPRVVDGVDVLGTTADLGRLGRGATDLRVVVCVAGEARPGQRLELATRLERSGVRFGTVVHPAASVAAGASVGAGSVLLAGAVVTAPISIGRHVVAMPHTVFTHDDEIGDGCTFASHATLGGRVTVGDGAYVGAGAAVREGVRIGAGAVVGQGSVVLSDVPAGEVWVGNPARVLRRPSPAVGAASARIPAGGAGTIGAAGT